MKSAYELAMERLEKASPSISLSEEQKKEIAEVDSVYRAKIAEKEVFLKDQIRKAHTAGNLRRSAITRETACLGNASVAGRVRSQEGKVAQELCQVVVGAFALASAQSGYLIPRLTQTPATPVGLDSPRFGRSGSRKPSICARLIVRTPSCFCKPSML